MKLIDIGPALKQKRIEKGISLARLAETSGYDIRTIARVEAGTPAVRLDSIINIAQALGVQAEVTLK